MRQGVLFWLGETNRPLTRDRSADYVMDSIINYYSELEPSLPYSVGKLFLDNGAYTAASRGIDLSLERVITIQERIWPDRTLPLDYPYRPGMSLERIRDNWSRTKSNITLWQGGTKLSKRLVAPLHAWDQASLMDNVNWLQRNADTDTVALGSLIELRSFGGFFGDRQPNLALIDSLSSATRGVKASTDFKVHVMGLGSSPLMLHFAYYLGVDSTDSSGYRRKAAYGKIVLPGTGERYIGNSSAGFGLTRYSESDLELLSSCTCPVCRINQDMLVNDWRARALHNEYVMKAEVRKAQTLLEYGRDAYEKYLDKVFARSSLNYLWKHAKLTVKYSKVTDALLR